MTLPLYHPLHCGPGRGIPITYLINLKSFFQGHYHEEVKSGVTQNHKFYQGSKQIQMIYYSLSIYIITGYPGQPEIESSHFIEQSPGLGHPFLPGADSDIDVDHFLWTGDIDSEEELQDVTDEEFVESEDGFRVTSKIYPDIPVIRPTSVLVTRYHSHHHDISVTCDVQGGHCVHLHDPAHPGVCPLWLLLHPGLP